MIPKLFFSQRLDALIPDIELLDPMETRTILVPNAEIRQWLLLEMAKRKGIAMGLKVLTPEQFFSFRGHSLELFCRIYSALLQSNEPELTSYLDGKKKRIFQLTKDLSTFFVRYSQYPDKLPTEKNWQTDLFHKVFSEQILQVNEPIISFGIDALPPIYWQALLTASDLSVYLFSPCVEFWEDICTDRERKKMTKACKEIDPYLREAPRNLANWGKLGRGTLSLFDIIESEELYLPLEPTTHLKKIQYDFLTFQKSEEVLEDDSIKVFLTGSSRLREIEVIKNEILRLDVPYSEISVLAPNLESYVPLIEYVFGSEIPYRISKVDLASQSHFRQGILRILAIGSGRWNAEEVLSLFETPAFYREKGWGSDELELFRDWMKEAQIRWGIDRDHRNQKLQKILGDQEYNDEGSWEKGLGELLDCMIFLKPMQINPDLFEEFLSTLYALKELDLKGEKSLKAWSDALEMASHFLKVDHESEADQAATAHFRSTLLEMRQFPEENLYPVEIIQHFLSRPCYGQLHASKLHAVRFFSFDEGAQIPARAMFLIGMDEMSFPKVELSSSLDLLKGKIPTSQDHDRYRFLQSIFSATEYLRISYCHLSEDEGKAVGPSLLVEELIGNSCIEIIPPKSRNEPKKNLLMPKFTKSEIPEKDLIISISDLRQLARHPWRFFLQKSEKIFLNEKLEETFALQRGKMVRELFEKKQVSKGSLTSSFREAMLSEVIEKVEERKTQLDVWQIEPISLHFRENCKESFWENGNYVVPALELFGKIKLVGEIKETSLKGMISLNEDNIAGTLKIWPEALMSAIALEAPQIWNLRSGKSKIIENAKENLEAYLEYYFCALSAPSPLLTEWADSILRKNGVDLDKKIERDSMFEDPIVDWVFARSEIPTANEWMKDWGPLLQKTFQALKDLYPTRGVGAKI